jgi:hypothetical protein
LRGARLVWFAILAGAAICSVAFPVRAQEASKTQAEVQEKVPNAYRLNFSIYELEDGKRINSRQYSMNLNAGDGNEIKIGTRVPVEIKQGQFEYLDVGTSIWCKLRERGNDLSLDIRSEVSNFAAPDQQAHGAPPLLRTFAIRGSTVVAADKPAIVGSVDDPSSKRQFQLEVTVTKLR